MTKKRFDYQMETKRKCFTLIELLVVIAIIAILAGMLLPALNNARGSAKQSQCVNNNKQLLLYMNQYIDDHNGFMPISAGSGLNTHYVSGDLAPYWMHAVNLYYKNTNTARKVNNLYSCPSDPHLFMKRAGKENGQYGFALSYSANLHSFPYCSNKTRNLHKRTSIHKPSEHVWFVELGYGVHCNPGDTTPHYNGFGSTEYLAKATEYILEAHPNLLIRHKGYITAGRVDGHVEPIKYPALSCSKNLFMWYRTGVRNK